MSPFNQPMSPTANGNLNLHSSPVWPQPNVPTLHLPGSNLQSSRLRSSFNARDIPQDFDFDAHQHIFNDLNCLSRKTLFPSNLEELFSAEISSSPRYSDQGAVFSPTRNSAVLNQFQQQQSMLSPMNTNVFSPKSVEHSLLHASFGVGSPGRMSPRNVDPISPIGVRLSAFGQREMQLRSLSSREFGANVTPNIGSPMSSFPKWGSPHGKADWSLHSDEMGHVNSFERVHNNGEEPDLSWVQSLVKESPPEMMKENLAGSVSSGPPPPPTVEVDSMDHSVIGDWLEQMQLDQLVV
jgi:hypothetical protein